MIETKATARSIGRTYAAPLVFLLATSGGCGLADKLTGPDTLAIQKFVATPSQVDPGSTVMLIWDVAGAESVQISGGVGTVAAKGSFPVRPTATIDYQLTARAGTSSATATVEVRVTGTSASPSPEPSPTPSPSPSPSPSPTPSPSPSASPSPSPSPEPSPSPAPSPEPLTCGVPATFQGSCGLTIQKLDLLPSGECIELTDIRTSSDCPVSFGVPLSVSFEITASSSHNFTWNQYPRKNDVLTPASGTVSGTGTTNVTLSDIVLDTALSIEVIRGDKMYLVFSLKH